MPASAPRLYAVPALEKGLDLLEALAARAAPVSQAELARLVRRSPSEIFRMLNCLERRGYVAREPASGRVRLTLRLFELAHAHTPVDQLLRAADGPLRDLVAETGESCHLSGISRGQLVVLAQADSPRRIRLSVEVGGRFPLVRTASGRVLLAHLPPVDLDATLAGDPDWAALDAPARRRFLGDLIHIRRTGVYSGKSDLTRGIHDVAVLVGNPRVGVAASLCVPLLAAVGRVRPIRQIRAAAAACAVTITKHLGLTPMENR